MLLSNLRIEKMDMFDRHSYLMQHSHMTYFCVTYLCGMMFFPSTKRSRVRDTSACFAFRLASLLHTILAIVIRGAYPQMCRIAAWRIVTVVRNYVGWWNTVSMPKFINDTRWTILNMFFLCVGICKNAIPIFVTALQPRPATVQTDISMPTLCNAIPQTDEERFDWFRPLRPPFLLDIERPARATGPMFAIGVPGMHTKRIKGQCLLTQTAGFHHNLRVIVLPSKEVRGTCSEQGVRGLMTSLLAAEKV
jgi:hypothetical protein